MIDTWLNEIRIYPEGISLEKLTLKLMEEVGEFAEGMFHDCFRLDEMADIMIVCMLLLKANGFQVFEEFIQNKLNKLYEKYPDYREVKGKR
jgi:NTP pyrophosphatase (non-canonical NTP hydrolase)